MKVSEPTRHSANSGDPTNLCQQYGPVYFSHPQRFIINYAYDLPLGKHQGALGISAKRMERVAVSPQFRMALR